MKSSEEVRREREVAVLDAAAGVADLLRYDGELTCDKETFKFRFEQLRVAVFRLRDTCGEAPLRTTLGDLVKFAKRRRVEARRAVALLPPSDVDKE